jgi:glycosyltransferase involved in cell wall biosynthesis
MSKGLPPEEDRSVLIVQRSSALDGSAHSGLLLVDGLREAGWDTHVAFGFEGPMVERHAAAGHEVSVVPHENWLRRDRAHQFVKDVWVEWRRAGAFERLIEEVEADVVYVNTIVSFAAAVAARRTGTQCIWHLREMFSDIGGEMRAPGWAKPLVRGLIHRHADQMVANSGATARNLLGEGAEEATIIPNAVGAAFFEEDRSRREARSVFGLSSDGPVIGVPGTLRPMKGHPFFFEAVAPVLRERPGVQAAVTGGGDEAFVARLEGQLRDLGIREQVELLGWVEDMPAFYRACDLVCIPSRAEPFGRTAIEAFAAGTPVVATAVGGLQETVTDEETGLLVGYGEAGEMTEAIGRLLESSDLRERMAERARQVGEKNYHEQLYETRIASLVESISPEVTPTWEHVEMRPGLKQFGSALVVQRSSALDGSAHSGLLLVDGLREAGWDTHVAFGFEGPMVERHAAAGHEVSVVPHENWLRRDRAHQFVKDVWVEWRRAGAFERLIEEVEADVVYVNTIVSFAAAVAARRTGTQCIWHLREMFSDIGGEMRAPGWAKPLVRGLIHRHADQMVANSGATARNLLGEGAEEATIIPNAVGAAFFEEDRSRREARSVFGLSSDGPVIGVPGTLRPMKGHPFFFEAVAPVLRERPGVQAAVTGGGDEAFVARLEGQLRDLGIREQVELLGWVEDMPAFYRACDLVCIPSRAEPFGRTAIEAFAAGTPVVATAVGGLQETVTDEETGLLVGYGEAGEMTEAIGRLLESSDLRERMAERARQVGEKNYHEDMYKDLITTLVSEVASEIFTLASSAQNPRLQTEPL